MISRTYAIDEESWIYDLKNVVAVISSGTHCDTFVQKYEGYHEFITKDPINMVPGERYFLRVSADNLDTLVGEMTACGKFEIRYPQEGDTINNADSIVFTLGEGVKSFNINLYKDSVLMFVIYSYVYQNDSIVRVHLEDFMLPEYLDGFIKIKIEEADKNFTDYKYLWSENELPQFGVTGGIGVFGSSQYEYRNIFMDVDK